MTKILYSFLTTIVALLIFNTSALSGDFNWIPLEKNYSDFLYDKKSLRKISAIMYETKVLMKESEGSMVVSVRINCKTQELFTGEIQLYDKKGNFVYSDESQNFIGGKPKGDKDIELLDLMKKKFCK